MLRLVLGLIVLIIGNAGSMQASARREKFCGWIVARGLEEHVHLYHHRDSRRLPNTGQTLIWGDHPIDQVFSLTPL